MLEAPRELVERAQLPLWEPPNAPLEREPVDALRFPT
jgi:hypothetical protein